jgi:hypothetical protein
LANKKTEHSRLATNGGNNLSRIRLIKMQKKTFLLPFFILSRGFPKISGLGFGVENLKSKCNISSSEFDQLRHSTIQPKITKGQ